MKEFLKLYIQFSVFWSNLTLLLLFFGPDKPDSLWDFAPYLIISAILATVTAIKIEELLNDA